MAVEAAPSRIAGHVWPPTAGSAPKPTLRRPLGARRSDGPARTAAAELHPTAAKTHQGWWQKFRPAKRTSFALLSRFPTDARRTESGSGRLRGTGNPQGGRLGQQHDRRRPRIRVICCIDWSYESGQGIERLWRMHRLEGQVALWQQRTHGRPADWTVRLVPLATCSQVGTGRQATHGTQPVCRFAVSPFRRFAVLPVFGFRFCRFPVLTF